MAYLSESELQKIGFASLGKFVAISDKVSFYNSSKISIGSYVRIDDYCLLSAGEGGIEIGNYVHISCYGSLIGRGKITLNDFTGISVKASVFSTTSDFSGNFLPGPIELPTIVAPDFEEFMINDWRPVIFEKFSIIGAHTVVLPGVTIGEGTAVGAMSFVPVDLKPWGIYLGTPARFIKKRSSDLFQKWENHIKSKITIKK